MHLRLTTACAVVALVALGMLVATVRPAQATYPGANGRLAFTLFPADGSNRDVYSTRPDGSGLRRLTTDPSFDACPAYSADGRQIVFCSKRSGSFEIWKMRKNGSDQRQLTHLGGFAIFPDLSPDGTKIVFSGGGPTATTDEVFVVNVNGTGLVQLTNGGGTSLSDFPAWSPDGRNIAFVSDRSGVEQVWVMNANGSDQKRLTTSNVPEDQVPDWSPDGRKIAYAEGDFGAGQNERIFVIDANGSNPHPLTSGAADDWGPAWSPDGKQIAFVRDFLNGSRPAYVMNANGSDQHMVNPGPVGAMAWAPRTEDD